MGDNNEKEVLKAYDKYLAYFLNNDMDGINSLVKFPITYIADGECKSLDAFPVKPKEMIENKQWTLLLIQRLMCMEQILLKVTL